MSILNGKNILLGVTGGIAAYKTASLVRLFIKSGAQVKVVMTPSAKDFVTPLTLSTLSKHPVYSSFTNEEDDNAVWNNHVDLGLWADLFVVAPATANTLSKMANGVCDNLLLATYLSAKCPIYFAPTMDLDMYKHPSTLRSFERLNNFGNIMIPATSGELASGLVGEGRMAEPEAILAFIQQDVLGKLPLRGKKVLITAGPTYEAIDPVRFIGNHSSGKMGFEIAKVAANLGAQVILVTGPTHQKVSHALINVKPVVNAQSMYDEVYKHFETSNIAILSAAVSDYKPKEVASQKIKNSKPYIKPFEGVVAVKAAPIKETVDTSTTSENIAEPDLASTTKSVIEPKQRENTPTETVNDQNQLAEKPIEVPEKEETIQLDLSSQGVSGLSLSSLKVQKEHKNKVVSSTDDKEVRDNEVNQESIEEHWKKFSDIIAVNGEKNMVALLQLDIPRLKNKVEIHYAVPNDTNRVELKKNSNELMAYLRDQLSNDALTLKLHLEVKEEKKFVYTNEDKYKALSEKNPTLALFKKKFNLEY